MQFHHFADDQKLVQVWAINKVGETTHCLHVDASRSQGAKLHTTAGDPA